MASSPSSPRRYPSDLTDKQWTLVEPLLPAPNTTGRYEEHPRRETVNAILYVVRAGCSWRQLPNDFPPWQTVYWYFQRWHAAGAVDRLHDALREQLRDEDDRDPMASAAIVDAQSVKGADTVGAASRGYDAGRKVNGRKRHIVVDTTGLLLLVMVTAASVQDRDGGARALERLRFVMPSVATVWADGGYATHTGTAGLEAHRGHRITLLRHVLRPGLARRGPLAVAAARAGHGVRTARERLRRPP